MNAWEAEVERMKDIKNKVDAVEGKKWEDGVGYVKQPDPKLHKYISFVKSGLRMVAAMILATGNLLWAGVFFYIAECLGIFEEMV